MTEYILTDKIRNVWAVNPATGDYSYEQDGRGYLYLDGVLLEQEEAALDIVSVGDYVYVWYGSLGTLAVYSGHSLIQVFDKVYSPKRGVGPYAVHYVWGEDFVAYENLLSLPDGQPLLAQGVPYRLYAREGMVFGHDPYRQVICPLDHSGQPLWSYRIMRLGGAPYSPNAKDQLESLLGVAAGLLWIYTDFGRLVAFDLSTGELVHRLSSNPYDSTNPRYTMVESLGVCFFREEDKAIVSINSLGVRIFDAATAACLESYRFADVDPDGIPAFKYFAIAQFQGDYFTFRAEQDGASYSWGWAGVFDLKARSLLWAGEVIPSQERERTGNGLVASRPLYYAGDKLYLLDAENTLHIYQRS